MRKKRVYISGGITGNDNYLNDFRIIETKLREHGFSAINPATIQSYMPEDSTRHEYMMVSMALMDMCDYVYMLPGWQTSTGALAEYHYAKSCGMEVFDYNTRNKLLRMGV